MKSVLNRSGATALALTVATVLLAACGGSTPLLSTASLPPPGNQPETLEQNAPVSLTQTHRSETVALSTALMPIREDQVKRAVQRFLLNSGGKPATSRIVGADLDGDNSPEALVYLEGADWCVSTGCTLLVMRKERTGYQLISEIKRVKLPLTIVGRATNGWRDLIVKSGQLGAQKLVALTFNGSGYPTNASVLQATAPPVDTSVEVAFRATRTAAQQTAAGSNLIAGQN